ncbi:MAG: NUDIX domain-containing protein [Parcubacteria group bacterium]|nr:NUDIX domain-containing protein [Parcubacteria group bacterium]
MSKEITYSDNNEMLLCFDEQDNVIAPQSRGVVHQKPYRIWHAITNIWVFNSKSEILCTRRASHVSGNPNKWQTYVGGHVRANSTFSETVKRELNEEIGLKISKDDFKLVEKGRRDDNMHVYESYAVLFNGDLSELNFSDGEVSEAQWLRFEEYQKLKEEKSEDWCNGVKPEQYRKALNILDISS